MQANINLTPQLIKQMQKIDNQKQLNLAPQGLASHAVTRLPSLFTNNAQGTTCQQNQQQTGQSPTLPLSI